MRQQSAEGVSKLEIAWFSGVALPLPKCREADTEHSGGSTFALNVEAACFDTPSANWRHSPPPQIGHPDVGFALRSRRSPLNDNLG
ncbi:hypothetical protein OKW41_000208 [Paraburkholderia sp. UCT70]